MSASNKSIPSEVKDQVKTTVDQFNRDVIQRPRRFYSVLFRSPDRFFSVRFRGVHAYLDRQAGNSVSRVGRLTYTGDIKDWDFAIYKYSTERYDPDEWMFPGSEHLNGTIEGALRACMEAYP